MGEADSLLLAFAWSRVFLCEGFYLPMMTLFWSLPHRAGVCFRDILGLLCLLVLLTSSIPSLGCRKSRVNEDDYTKKQKQKMASPGCYSERKTQLSKCGLFNLT